MAELVIAIWHAPDSAICYEAAFLQPIASIFNLHVLTLLACDILMTKHGREVLLLWPFRVQIVAFMQNASFPIGKRMEKLGPKAADFDALVMLLV